MLRTKHASFYVSTYFAGCVAMLAPGAGWVQRYNRGGVGDRFFVFPIKHVFYANGCIVDAFQLHAQKETGSARLRVDFGRKCFMPHVTCRLP